MFRQSLRSLRRTPWYALTVVGVIALSMALATTAFAVVDGVLFKPLPYERADELYRVTGATSGAQTIDATSAGRVVSPRDISEFRAALPDATFTLYRGGFGSSRGLGDLRTWIPLTAEVDRHFLEVLAVRPILGGFSPEDFETPPGALTPALISYGLWQSQLAGRPDVIGQTLAQYTGETGPLMSWRVVGVLPAGFQFPNQWTGQNLLTPLVVAPADADRRLHDALVRLPRVTSLAEVQAKLDAVRASLRSLDAFMSGSQRPTFQRLFGVALALIVLACVNISGLAASRGIDRRRELSLRRALGASARDLSVLMLVESAILIGAGALIGLVASRWLLSIVVPLVPSHIGLLKAPTLDMRVIGFALLASAISTMIIAMWPVRDSVRQPPARVLAGGSQAATASRSIGRFAIVSLQVALGFVLTIGGALVTSSLFRIWQTDIGFSTDHLLVIGAETVSAATPAQREEQVAAFLQDLRLVPGVVAAGVTRSSTILRRSASTGPFPDADTYPVSPGFFDAVQIKVVDGRLPTDDELVRKAPVIAISQEVAREHFGNERAIGREIMPSDGSAPVTVVGVVRETRFSGWDMTGQGGEVYTAFTGRSPSFSVLIRTTPEATGVLGAVLRLSTLPGSSVRLRRAATADALLTDTIRTRRFQAWLFGLPAFAAIVIVGVGVLGLVAMATARRTREIGIRSALGATRESIVRLLLREQLLAVVVGLTAGALLSAWTVRLLRSFLYELTPYDARLWLIAAVTIVATAGFGALIPSWRASRVDPVKALRVE